jgi:putative monooxygenase
LYKGAHARRDFHDGEESVLLLEGEAVAEIDEVEHPVAHHDVTFVPAGIPHRLRNLSADKGVTILWTRSSIDATRTWSKPATPG